MKIAIAIICIIPKENQIGFYETFNSDKYDIFFIIDNETFNTSYLIEKYPSINFIQISNFECSSNHFINSNFVIKKNPSGWDKVIYYFSTINTTYKLIWFLEDDVFVPTNKTIENIDNKYSQHIDLLSSSNLRNTDKNNEAWHWKQAKDKINLPWFKSMVCAIRVSQNLLSSIKNYVLENKELFFIEILFNTLCQHNSLRQFKIPELSNIVYRCKWKINQIKTNYLYHPIKDETTYNTFRSHFTK